MAYFLLCTIYYSSTILQHFVALLPLCITYKLPFQYKCPIATANATQLLSSAIIPQYFYGDLDVAYDHLTEAIKHQRPIITGPS